MRSLGADTVIDYTQQDFTEGDETYDVVFDAVGKLSASRGQERPEEGGCLSQRQQGLRFWGEGGPEDLVFLRRLVETGRGSGRSSTDAIRWRRSSRPTRTSRRGTRKGHVVVTVIATPDVAG